ncbi:Wzz/FepE/Etk N-terminal domain-containing protein [Pleionea litopenaei]|uniref:Wzz/FepE/Etk N-terminal domain-containing protein n=1 Tax=Pleionea litopenaei TaxID=3070815 RepID=A0AA51RTN4_9GAMM|nr:Wzz/FepE/Etk N-terminal domain-containing protein [Pleionea sp. HL-JVS1]WMS87274.1 Wzz/FepE/Etk N-terminal domain-containing protein [Pleionea sp. HL-JVS1]
MTKNSVLEEKQIELLDLIKIVFQYKWYISVVVVLFAAFSVTYSLLATPIYTSTAIVAPNSQAGDSMSKIAGQFGGLASIAGIDLGGGGNDDKVDIALKVLTTWGYIETFVEKHDLAKDLLAVEKWNKNTRKVIYNPDVYDSESGKWKGEYAEAPPSSWILYAEFLLHINVAEDKNSSFIEISIEHESPDIAKKWVDLIIKDINDYMREVDEKEARNKISYLEKQISETNIAEMRTIFYQLLEQQSKTLMLADVSDEYVLKTISSAKVAEERTRPKRAVIVVISTFLGGMFAVFTAILYGVFRREQSK